MPQEVLPHLANSLPSSPLAAWEAYLLPGAGSGQGLDRAGARVDEVAGHHAAEAASRHLQRSCARISPFGSRSQCTLRHSHQGRSMPWNSVSTMLILCLLVPARYLTIAATLRQKLVWHQHR